jgi:hypothetical protein
VEFQKNSPLLALEHVLAPDFKKSGLKGARQLNFSPVSVKA